MSWARIDDGLWEHPKFEAMRLAGERDAIALWALAISYCGKKQNPRITTHEAMMLLCCSEADAKQTLDVLRSRGLADTDSASEQSSSILIHDWEQYRSKDEAKVIAGRKGGRRSAESRQLKTQANHKQERSKGQADAKQRSSPGTVPGTVPGTDPDPDPGTVSTSTERSENPNLEAFAEEAANAGITVSCLSSDEREWFSQLYPVKRHELDHAVECAKRSKPDRPSYLLGVIEKERKRVEERKLRPKPPGATEKPEKQLRDLSIDELKAIPGFGIEWGLDERGRKIQLQSWDGKRPWLEKEKQHA